MVYIATICATCITCVGHFHDINDWCEDTYINYILVQYNGVNIDKFELPILEI